MQERFRLRATLAARKLQRTKGGPGWSALGLWPQDAKKETGQHPGLTNGGWLVKETEEEALGDLPASLC